MRIKILSGIVAMLLVACSSSTIQDPAGKLTSSTTSIQSVGENEVMFYNTGKSPVSINSVSLEDKTTSQIEVDQDVILKDKSTCERVTLNSNQSCKVVLLNQNAKNGTDEITIDSSVGKIVHSIKISTPSGDLDLSNNQISQIGLNKFTIINNRNSNITLASLLFSTDTQDTSSDLANCFGVTLKPNDTCTFNIKAFADQIGKDKVTINTNVGNYNYDIAVSTGNNDLTLNSHAIAQSGDNNFILTNNAINPIKITNVNFSQINTYDSADLSDCNNKTLKNNETCTIKITSEDKIAGVDNLLFNTDLGNYTHTIQVNTTGEGVLDTDDTANLKTTKEQAVKVYNKGNMPIRLKNLNVAQETTLQKTMRMVGFTSNNDDTLQVDDSSCLNQVIGGQQVCQIKAKAKGNTNTNHLVNFTSNNTYMNEQSIETKQKTTETTLGFFKDNDKDAITNVILESPTLVNISLKNTGTNDMTIKKLELNNTNVGDIATDTCTGSNVYAGETCQIGLQVKSNAYGKIQLTAITEQDHPNNTIMFSINNESITYVDNALKNTMQTNTTKEFTIKNPGKFAITISNLIFDTTSYSVIENQCNGATLQSNGTCKFKLTSNNNLGTTSVKVVSDSYASAENLDLQVTNGLSISPINTSNVFYQSFKIENPVTASTATVSINNQTTGTFVADGQSVDIFSNQNCAKFNGNIPSNTVCEYMLAYPENTSINSENLSFNISSDGGTSTATQNYVSKVVKHNVNIPANYLANQTINAYQTISQTQCNGAISSNLASAVWNYSLLYSSVGYLLKTGSDGVSLYVTLFFVDNACYVQKDILIPNYSVSTKTQLAKIAPNSYSHIELYLDVGGGCKANICTLPLITTGSVEGVVVPTVSPASITFTQPVFAQNYTVVDSITWNTQ